MISAPGIWEFYSFLINTLSLSTGRVEKFKLVIQGLLQNQTLNLVVDSVSLQIQEMRDLPYH